MQEPVELPFALPSAQEILGHLSSSGLSPSTVATAARLAAPQIAARLFPWLTAAEIALRLYDLLRAGEEGVPIYNAGGSSGGGGDLIEECGNPKAGTPYGPVEPVPTYAAVCQSVRAETPPPLYSGEGSWNTGVIWTDTFFGQERKWFQYQKLFSPSLNPPPDFRPVPSADGPLMDPQFGPDALPSALKQLPPREQTEKLPHRSIPALNKMAASSRFGPIIMREAGNEAPDQVQDPAERFDPAYENPDLIIRPEPIGRFERSREGLEEPRFGPPTHEWAPPSGFVREKKLKANYGTLFRFLINAYTETHDFVSAIHKALPKKSQCKAPFGKRLTLSCMLQHLYDHLDQVDWYEAAGNVFENMAQDAMIGLANRGANRAFSGYTGRSVAGQGVATALGHVQNMQGPGYDLGPPSYVAGPWDAPDAALHYARQLFLGGGSGYGSGHGR